MKMNDKINICNYAGAFIDILGQQDRLNQFSRMPDMSDGETREAFVATIKKTVGTINSLSAMSHKFFRPVNLSSVTEPIPQGIQAEVQGLVRKDLKIQKFSDGLFAYTPLANDLVLVPQVGVHALIMMCGVLCLTSLAAESPIRGGIEIGWGLEYEPGQLYGSVVSQSYHLESKVAGYPRFVIGKQLRDYLEAEAQAVGEGVHGSMRKESAKLCMDLLVNDDDGNLIVDYLGPQFKKCGDVKVTREAVRKAYSYVLQQLMLHKQQRNTKLAFRYVMLRNYFDTRVGEWGIKDH